MSARVPGMRSRLLVVGIAALACGCTEETTRGETRAAPNVGAEAPPRVPGSALIPGAVERTVTIHNPYSRDATAVRDGERLYGWYNCSGCHAGGGGGMGPPLMDERWIYGSRPANLFDVIVEGRPGGMPAFGAHIPDDEIWKIIAYIESMGGMQPGSGVIAGDGGASLQQQQSQPQN